MVERHVTALHVVIWTMTLKEPGAPQKFMQMELMWMEITDTVREQYANLVSVCHILLFGKLWYIFVEISGKEEAKN